MELLEHKQKFGKVVSSGLQCMKTLENSFEGVEAARCMVAIIAHNAMPLTYNLQVELFDV